MTLYPKEYIIGRNCRFLQGGKKTVAFATCGGRLLIFLFILVVVGAEYTDPATVNKIRQAIKEGRSLDVEILNYRRDGVAFWNRFRWGLQMHLFDLLFLLLTFLFGYTHTHTRTHTRTRTHPTRILAVHKTGKTTGVVTHFIAIQKDVTLLKDHSDRDPVEWSAPEVAMYVE